MPPTADLCNARPLGNNPCSTGALLMPKLATNRSMRRAALLWAALAILCFLAAAITICNSQTTLGDPAYQKATIHLNMTYYKD